MEDDLKKKMEYDLNFFFLNEDNNKNGKRPKQKWKMNQSTLLAVTPL